MARCITCFRCVRICDEVQGQFVWRVWNRGDATRILPDSGTTLRESTCVSCGACVDACPSGALEDKTVLQAGVPAKWTRTTCPYCGVGCEMRVGTRDNRIVQVRPVPDAPVNKGHLCVKGRYAFAFTHAADRVTEPMIRDHAGQAPRLPAAGGLPVGAKAGGAPTLLPGWRVVSWPEAIQFVATRLRRILQESGPDSIGVLGSARGTNEENYLAQKFARVVLGTNNVDGCARVCHQPTATGMFRILGTGAATNSFDDIQRARTLVVCGCNPTENHPIVGARIKQAVLRGAHLIVIDPREIELARYADVHLQLRPGTNVPLLNAIACAILEAGAQDDAVLRERVSGWEEFARFVRSWIPERAEAICGVAAERIRQAARLYATAKPAMCFHGLGLTEQTQGTETVMALVNLALITGNFGRPGSGLNPLRGQNNVQGSAHMGCEPAHLTGYVTLDAGRTAFERAWQAPLPAGKGLNLMEMVDAAATGRLKALWAIGYDVAHTNPNAGATRRALAKLELVIVQDLFMNELAQQAGTVFLPAVSSFEKEGTFMNAERRVQRVRPAIPPPGNARPDWQILCDIARAMGHGEQFNFNSPRKIWDEIRSVWAAGAGMTYDRLDQGGLQWPCPTVDHPGTAILHTDSFPGGGRAPLQTVDFTPTPEIVSAEFPFLLTTGRSLYQFNAGTMTRRTANDELAPADYLDMSGADADRLGVRDGEPVRMRSRYGQGVLPVRINAAVKPGELFATFHTVETSLNQITSPHRDRHEATPEYKVTAVNVEKLP
jgi:formate dehydrogenase major subunit